VLCVCVEKIEHLGSGAVKISPSNSDHDSDTHVFPPEGEARGNPYGFSTSGCLVGARCVRAARSVHARVRAVLYLGRPIVANTVVNILQHSNRCLSTCTYMRHAHDTYCTCHAHAHAHAHDMCMSHADADSDADVTCTSCLSVCLSVRAYKVTVPPLPPIGPCRCVLWGAHSYCTESKEERSQRSQKARKARSMPSLCIDVNSRATRLLTHMDALTCT
jgi:hypothetical protein